MLGFAQADAGDGVDRLRNQVVVGKRVFQADIRRTIQALAGRPSIKDLAALVRKRIKALPDPDNLTHGDSPFCQRMHGRFGSSQMRREVAGSKDRAFDLIQGKHAYLKIFQILTISNSIRNSIVCQ